MGAIPGKSVGGGRQVLPSIPPAAVPESFPAVVSPVVYTQMQVPAMAKSLDSAENFGISWVMIGLAAPLLLLVAWRILLHRNPSRFSSAGHAGGTSRSSVVA